MNNMRERMVEKHLVERLRRIGIPCVKFIPDNMKGMPDRLVLLPDGKVVWVELKTDGGKLEIIQEVRHMALAKAGHRVVVVWNTDEADRLTEEIKKAYQL